MTSKRKRNDLSLKQKYKIVAMLDQKMTQKEISVQLECSASTISKIASKKEEIRSLFKTTSNTQRKRQRSGTAADVETVLSTWVNNAKTSGALINGPILTDKAIDIGKQLGHNDFSASSCWLSRWKVRNSIRFRRQPGGKREADDAPTVQRDHDLDVNASSPDVCDAILYQTSRDATNSDDDDDDDEENNTVIPATAAVVRESLAYIRRYCTDFGPFYDLEDQVDSLAATSRRQARITEFVN